ncbi:hypothetical protein EX30DRAFT_354901 [Ascodesmis nigricans]|uniref:Protein kinase domain-containing protein n=1 Tax=Ascodesmis nigricans TaxID=341454 RepID=A0A4S2MY92_9PEZI|nr:hypothetical protein EX30DRAFT_354901 [Ascodesmis nigricans]
MAHLAMASGEVDTIFSSMYGGYCGGAAVLPPPVVMNTTFWDDEKINSTVTDKYVRQQLPESLRKKLEEPMDSGAGLTDSTYLEWILERTKKIFLILSELGCAEKIFDLIDGSAGAWDDWDLPITPGNLEDTMLGPNVEKKFYKKQYLFLLQNLDAGQHIDYLEDEIIPLETVFRPTTGRGAPILDKVYYPRHRDVFYSRKRIPLATYENPEGMVRGEFMEEIHALKRLSHPHIVSLHASYTHQDNGYLLLYPFLELNLKSFLNYPPSTFKLLPKDKRRLTLFDWMHCLTDAVAFLSESGIEHNSIKPSSVIIDPQTWQIYLSDIGIISYNLAVKDNASFWAGAQTNQTPTADIEAYEYGAPELWIRTLTTHENAQNSSSSLLGNGRTKRHHTNPALDLSPPLSPVHESSATFTTTSSDRSIRLGSWTSRPSATRERADVFSLGCIFLDLLSFHAKKKPSAFIFHRTAKNRRPREGAPPDASFHSNLPQVELWMDQLEKHAGKKQDRVMADALAVVREMLEPQPAVRASIRRTEQNLYRVVLGLEQNCTPHCGAGNSILGGGVDPGGNDRMKRLTTVSSSTTGRSKSTNSGKRTTSSSFGSFFSRNKDKHSKDDGYED